MAARCTFIHTHVSSQRSTDTYKVGLSLSLTGPGNTHWTGTLDYSPHHGNVGQIMYKTENLTKSCMILIMYVSVCQSVSLSLREVSEWKHYFSLDLSPNNNVNTNYVDVVKQKV